MTAFRLFAAPLLALAAGAAFAQAAAPVTATAPWARATVQGQRSTGAFMTLVAREPLTLVGVASPVGTAELHEMRMDGDVMRMRALDRLELPAGQPVQLRPGSYHLMLMDLKAPLQPGANVPVTLSFRTAGGETRQLALQVPVSATAPKEAGAAAAPAGHGSHGAHKH
jgi:copper(I)-binding protein